MVIKAEHFVTLPVVLSRVQSSPVESSRVRTRHDFSILETTASPIRLVINMGGGVSKPVKQVQVVPNPPGIVARWQDYTGLVGTISLY